ncbi:MAG: nucleotidyltransferase domain-containing protein [Sarcina sp.]
MEGSFIRLLRIIFNDENLNEFKSISVQEWNLIYQEAKAHSLEAILYYIVKEKNIDVPKESLDIWKKDTFLVAIYQNRHVNNVSVALDKLYQSGIPTIALKGLVLRNLYPKPELRTMGDADLLVRVEDLELAKEVLEKLGYLEEEGDHPAHKVYHNEVSKIELHWKLLNYDIWGREDNLDVEVWESSEEFCISGAECFTLGKEELFVHLLGHMMVHMSYSGFGLRQVLDLAFLLNENLDGIDWEKVILEIKRFDILKFSLAILEACKRIFKINLAKEIIIEIESTALNEKYIELLIEDILKSGTFGRKNRVQEVTKSSLNSRRRKQGENLYFQYFRMFFPKRKNMIAKYSYAANRFLLPIAWGHRLLNISVKREYTFKEKKELVANSINNTKKRERLLKYLEVE